MTEFETVLFPSFLRQNYFAIRNLDLKNHTNEDNIELFLKYLNDAQPILDEEKAYKRLLLNLYRRNRKQFYTFIKQNKMYFSLLWLDGYCIQSHFLPNDYPQVLKWKGSEYVMVEKE